MKRLHGLGVRGGLVVGCGAKPDKLSFGGGGDGRHAYSHPYGLCTIVRTLFAHAEPTELINLVCVCTRERIENKIRRQGLIQVGDGIWAICILHGIGRRNGNRRNGRRERFVNGKSIVGNHICVRIEQENDDDDDDGIA